MCRQPGSAQQPTDVPAALVMLDQALQVLAGADAASLPTGTQAQALRVLEVAEARHTAARARFLSAFAAQDGYEADGQGSARTWLRWQTRITRPAAAGAVGWARRPAPHPVIAGALAAGGISAPWPRAFCGRRDRRPAGGRAGAAAVTAGRAPGSAYTTPLVTGQSLLPSLVTDCYLRGRRRRYETARRSCSSSGTSGTPNISAAPLSTTTLSPRASCVS